MKRGVVPRMSRRAAFAQGPEYRALERMGDHDVVANFDCEQGSSLRVAMGLAEYPASGVPGLPEVVWPGLENSPVVQATRRAAGPRASATAAEAEGGGRRSKPWTRAMSRPLPTWLETVEACGYGRRLQASRSRLCHHNQLISSTVASSQRTTRWPCGEPSGEPLAMGRLDRSRTLASAGPAKPTPIASANSAPAGIDVDQRDVCALEVPAGIEATRDPTTPAPTMASAIGRMGPGAGVP